MAHINLYVKHLVQINSFFIIIKIIFFALHFSFEFIAFCYIFFILLVFIYIINFFNHTNCLHTKNAKK